MSVEETKQKHLVIVDDEPVNLALAENALGGSYKLTTLVSGEQLLRFLLRKKPDLILLDVQMPDMNGYEVLRRLSENPQTKDIPVVFLSGQHDTDSAKEGFRLGAKDFIAKPFDSELIRAKLQAWLELYSRCEQLEEVIAEKTSEIELLRQSV